MAKTIQPDHNIEAEMSLLGSMILSTSACQQMVRELDAGDFFRPAHQTIFSALEKLIRDKYEIDPVLLQNRLKERGELGEVGGMEYLIQLAEAVPSAANASHYASVVKAKRVQREMRWQAETLAQGALSSEFETNDDRFSRWRQSFEAVRDKHADSSQIPPSLNEIFVNVDTELFEASNGSMPELKDITSGFPSLDKVFGGFFPGDQVVVGGYSGDGKTSFAFEAVIQSALSTGAPWLFVSCEMTKEDILRRFIQSRTGISVVSQRRGKVDGVQYQEIRDVMEQFHKLPVYIVDERTTLDQVYVMALKVRKAFGRLGGIAVDYLQLFKNQQPRRFRTSNDAEDLNAIVDRMKDIAKEMRCSTVVLSQFNRESQRDERAPRLMDLKGSGGIENSADVVLLLHRPNKTDGRSGSEQAEVVVAKARFGKPSKVGLKFTPSRVLWSEL